MASTPRKTDELNETVSAESQESTPDERLEILETRVAELQAELLSQLVRLDELAAHLVTMSGYLPGGAVIQPANESTNG